MKTKKEKKDDSDSLKRNSMALGGKSPKSKKADNSGPVEFEEDESMNLRMKEQALNLSKYKKS